MLELLLGAEGAVVSTEEILERAWDDAIDPFTNTVRMTISRLRAKLGDPPVIETVTPVGYRIGRRVTSAAQRRSPASRLRHPQTTVRWRLTLLYGGLFLVCGAALLAITYTLVEHVTDQQRAVVRSAPRRQRPPAVRRGRATAQAQANLHVGPARSQGSHRRPGRRPPPVRQLLQSTKGQQGDRRPSDPSSGSPTCTS